MFYRKLLFIHNLSFYDFSIHSTSEVVFVFTKLFTNMSKFCINEDYDHFSLSEFFNSSCIFKISSSKSSKI